jgi:hypothetical protein
MIFRVDPDEERGGRYAAVETAKGKEAALAAAKRLTEETGQEHYLENVSRSSRARDVRGGLVYVEDPRIGRYYF